MNCLRMSSTTPSSNSLKQNYRFWPQRCWWSRNNLNKRFVATTCSNGILPALWSLDTSVSSPSFLKHVSALVAQFELSNYLSCTISLASVSLIQEWYHSSHTWATDQEPHFSVTLIDWLIKIGLPAELRLQQMNSPVHKILVLPDATSWRADLVVHSSLAINWN